MLFRVFAVSLPSCCLANAADIPFLFPNGVINAASRTAARVKRPQTKIAAMTTHITAAGLKSADLLGARAVLTRTMAANVLVARVGELLKSYQMPYVARP